MGQASQPLWDIEETATHLGVSIPWIYKAVREGKIPVTRFGRSLRFDPRALDRFIERSTTPPREIRAGR
jgi:excisionase family DNA binding protein